MNPHDNDETKPSPPRADETVEMARPGAEAPRVLLGRYRVLGPLGRGGMGEALRCHDTVSGTEVAVKLLRPEFAAHPEHVESVRSNFVLIERLHHPNIAALKTLERDPATGGFLVVMELVEGQGLDAYLRERGNKIGLAQALPLLQQLAAALDCGHREKIIHRDLKPSNVMIDLRGRVKLLDFGVAERFHAFPAAGDPQVQDRISGTAPYMAPEQWRGQYQDARTDQYALAVLAFRMLVGQPPFGGRTADEIRDAVLDREAVPPVDWPPALRAAVSRGLAKAREDRFGSCEEFVHALAAAVPSAGRAGAAPAPVRRAVFAALVLALAGGGLWWATRRAPAPPPPAAAPAPAEAPAAAGLPAYSALVIGISDYRSHGADGWDDLQNARADAAEVGRVLAERYGFRVRTLLDEQATRSNILDALDELGRQGPDEAALVFFAGHGHYERELGEGYWIPHDARRLRDGKPSRGDWIWNSTITKLIDAAAARHVLVIADACFGGSLFRGDDALPAGDRQLQWYRRALTAPSRYLITSGDLEKVLDAGPVHTVFCRTLLNYLSHPAKDVFAASDLGAALKERVGALTGQMVRMGQLPVASHAGGEFVFVAKADGLGPLPPAEPAPTNRPGATRDWAAAAQDAIALAQQGATGSAQRALTGLAAMNADPQVVDLVRRYVSGEQQRKADAQIGDLIQQISARTNRVTRNARVARPRVFSFEDTRVEAGLAPDVFSVLLSGALADHRGLRIARRDRLDAQLREVNLGTSALADPAAGLEIGRLLAASVQVVYADASSSGEPTIRIELVDNETGEEFARFQYPRPAAGELAAVGRRATDEIAAAIIKHRPLLAGVAHCAGADLVAGVGRFQGAVTGQVFDVIVKNPSAAFLRDREHVLGEATVTAVDVLDAELTARWAAEPPTSDQLTNVWVRERL